MCTFSLEGQYTTATHTQSVYAEAMAIYDVPRRCYSHSPPTPSPRQPERTAPPQREINTQGNGSKNGNQNGQKQPSSQRKEKGMSLFLKQQQYVTKVTEEDSKIRDDTLKKMEGITLDPALSPEHKTLFAETIREVSRISHGWCVCVYMYACVYACTYGCVCMHVWVCKCVCMCVSSVC